MHRALKPALFLAAAIVLLVLPRWLDSYSQYLVNLAMAYILVNLGLNLLLGYAGQFAFANAAFMVAPDVQRSGVGRRMAEHCLGEARRLGFRAMQFNFVVSTNEGAIRLWKQLGFKIVGTLPGAFRHPQKGYVDVYVMFRSLEEAGKG